MKVIIKLISIILLSLLLSACNNSSEKYNNIVKYINNNYVNLLDKNDENPVSVDNSNDDILFISLHVRDNYSNLNKRNQWDNIADLATSLGTISEFRKVLTSTNKKVHVYLFNSEHSWSMNVFGEKKMNSTSTYKMWMTQYYDDDGNPKFYPSYYDENANI